MVEVVALAGGHTTLVVMEDQVGLVAVVVLGVKIMQGGLVEKV